jgi:hypothetical protein
MSRRRSDTGRVQPRTDYWGRRLSAMPRDFIFGYGSLINTHLRDHTSVAPIAGMPARLSAAFGFVRAWVFRCPSGFTALGLRRPRRGEPAMTVNGVMYPVEPTDLAAFDMREAGYVRVPVPLDQIEAVSWQAVPASGTIWTYVPADDAGTASRLVGASDEFPLLQSYIDATVEGALDYGVDYAREVIETTADWSPYWLNDREMARRPWIYDRHYAEADALLSTTEPAAGYFADRMFPGPFSVRWHHRIPAARPPRLRKDHPARRGGAQPLVSGRADGPMPA